MLSRCTTWALMFASATTLVAITVDRYLYFAKPLKYPLIVTRRRVFFAVSGIWLAACCLFIGWYVHIKNYSVQFRSLCHIPDSIAYFMDFFIAYLPLTLIFFLNFQVLSLARKQRINAHHP